MTQRSDESAENGSCVADLGSEKIGHLYDTSQGQPAESAGSLVNRKGSIEGDSVEGDSVEGDSAEGGQSVFSVFWDVFFWDLFLGDVFFLPCSSETLTTIPKEMTAIPMICLMVMFS